MKKKRVLIAHPRVTAAGGGNGVAAWALQALREDFDVSLATLQPLDCDQINRTWGTSLRAGDVRVHLAPRGYERLLSCLPTAAALLEICLVMRFARSLDERNPYDVLLGTQNEADFGRRGITYVHHPWVYRPRPENEAFWYNHFPGSQRAYRALCRRISRGSDEGLRLNLLLANSSFIAERISALHGIDSTVLFPPVTSEFPDVPWQRSEEAVIAIGRMSVVKRWEMAVAIVDELRQRGHPLGLTLIGHREDPTHLARLHRLATTRPWFRIFTDLSRDDLKALVARHRYGIHPMEDEDFGMAPAELLNAGCLLFAHNSGGPVEILGGEGRLLFEDVADAVDKIEAVLRNATLAAELRAHTDARRRLFSTDAFCESLRQIVDRFARSVRSDSAPGGFAPA